MLPSKPPYPWCDNIDHDSFGRLDLSGQGGYSGAIGCMFARMAELDSEIEAAQIHLASLRKSRGIAENALYAFCDLQYDFAHSDRPIRA